MLKFPVRAADCFESRVTWWPFGRGAMPVSYEKMSDSASGAGGDDYKRVCFITLPQHMTRLARTALRTLRLRNLRLSSAALLAASLFAVFTVAPAAAQDEQSSLSEPARIEAAADSWTNIDEFGETVRPITFPLGGDNYYTDTWLAARGSGRRHVAVDMMADKLVPIYAVRAGCITWLTYGGPGGGNMLTLTDADGWQYRYIHLNNDTPGTDDGANPYEWAFAVNEGDCVSEGQLISYVGDSGNAEWVGSHLHLEIINPDGIWINPYHSVLAAESGNGSGSEPCSGVGTNPPHTPSDSSARGYWLVDSEGRVHAYNAPHHGDLTSIGVTTAPASMTATASGDGYWIVDVDGLVHAFGDATFHGDMRGWDLNGPVRRIEPHPSGNGYWLVADDGGVFTFGTAEFQGSLGDRILNAPVISMTTTTTGNGYWLVASDGGVFTFGDAEFLGSTANLQLNQPVIDMAVNPTGNGYWLYAADGGVFTFGSIGFHGSAPGTNRCDVAPSVALRPTNTGSGYWIATVAGEVLAFGDAKHHGDLPNLEVLAADAKGDDPHVHATVVDLAIHHTN
jgi:murein DD-endopeptidase MepM/ murein hydrolase activator NlpD